MFAGKPVARLVFEETGPYHRAFERAMGEAGLPLCKVNPRQAKRFGETLGQLAKTERMDAGMLASCGALVEPGVRAAPSKIISDLTDLHVARIALVRDRTATKNREKNLTLSLLKRHVRQRPSSIQSHLKEIEETICTLIDSDDHLRRKFAIRISMPGIAERSAFALLIDIPELGTLEAQETAALSGTAPITRQPGKRTGKAFVSSGRVNVRQALYTPARVAARFKPDLKDKYKEFTARGKPPKVAITAIMRKLVILANALIRDDREWSPRMA